MPLSPEDAAWLHRVLTRLDFFAGLSLADVSDLVGQIQKFTYKAGDAIVREGEKGNAFFIIYRGQAEVFRKKGFFTKQRLATLAAEQFFGELSLLNEEPRGASVRALSACETFVLFKEDFDALVEKSPVFRAVIRAVSARRAKPK